MVDEKTSGGEAYTIKTEEKEGKQTVNVGIDIGKFNVNALMCLLINSIGLVSDKYAKGALQIIQVILYKMLMGEAEKGSGTEELQKMQAEVQERAVKMGIEKEN